MTDTRAPHSSAVVPIALWLGYAGLIPFAAGAAMAWLLPPEWRPFAAAALSAYAAVIVSFLGGIHWGIGFRDGTPWLFLWGVVPSLLAVSALMLSPLHGLLVHGLVLLLCYAVDRRVYRGHGLQAWLTLRWRLSLVAAACCFAAAAGSIVRAQLSVDIARAALRAATISAVTAKPLTNDNILNLAPWFNSIQVDATAP